MVEERKNYHNLLSGNNPEEINVPRSDTAPLHNLTSIAPFPKLVLFYEIFVQTSQKCPFLNVLNAAPKTLDNALVIE